MLPYFVFDHFNIEPWRFYTWGFFVGLAFSAGYLMMLYRARRANIETGKIIGLVLSIFIGAGLGSRLLFLLQAPQKFFNDISLLWHIDQGGLMLYGGVLGGILGGWLYIKMAPSPLQGEGWGEVNLFWKIADLATPAIALGIGIGRFGCFLINDHQGSPTSLPWGILWSDGIARHPVALYESLAGFALFVIFLLLEKYKQKILPSPPFSKEGVPPFVKGRLGGIFKESGHLFLFFLICYSVIRFLLDFLRASSGPLADPRGWGLTTSQWISIIALLFSFLFWIVSSHNKTLTTPNL